MAISRLAGAFNTNPAGHTVSASLGTLPSAGNAIAVMIWGSGTATATGESVADNQTGNSYALLIGAGNTFNGLRCAIYLCPSINAPSGTFTVTATMNASIADCSIDVVRVTTLLGTGVLTASNDPENTASTSVSSGTTSATTQADAIVFAVCSIAGSGTVTFTVPTGYTDDGQQTNNTSNQAGDGVDKILTATGTQNATWTIGTAQASLGCIAAVKGAGAATPDPFPAGYYQHPRQYLRI